MLRGEVEMFEFDSDEISGEIEKMGSTEIVVHPSVRSSVRYFSAGIAPTLKIKIGKYNQFIA
jgi:hypothetical protein